MRMRPVWNGYFADPDVIRTELGYYAFGTDAPDQPVYRDTGRIFPVLYSRDLREWELVAGALNPVAGGEALHYWAPEVAEKDGRFYMYYSAGGEEGEAQRLRVAISDHPAGPFEDQGRLLLPDEPFSIDASPFQDPVTGIWWLFFARDYFDGEFPGTGCALVRLHDDMVSVAGEAITVARPSAAWQLFERDRNWYGRTWPAWYTVEGPFCIFRQGQYRLYFSGGLWKGEEYGVAMAVADSVEGPYSELPQRILQSRTGLRGPGHNSIVIGPDGKDRICFHAWDESYTKRQMFVEPLPEPRS